jgi:hypothetical protein
LAFWRKTGPNRQFLGARPTGVARHETVPGYRQWMRARRRSALLLPRSTEQPPLPLTCAAADPPRVTQALRLVGCIAVPGRRGQTVGQPAGWPYVSACRTNPDQRTSATRSSVSLGKVLHIWESKWSSRRLRDRLVYASPTGLRTHSSDVEVRRITVHLTRVGSG